MSLDLRPTMLDDLGLIPALLWLFQRYTSQTGIKVVFEQSGMEERFSMQLETAAYRIVQEALTNTARYAATDQATVRLWRNAELLCVNVRDCGNGFVPEAVVSKRSTAGLAGMSERAKLLGGRLRIESSPGEGTMLSAELPVTLREEQLVK
jgi:signal transduction histidine kinase